MHTAHKAPTADKILEEECARLRRKYGSWMHASDISIEEKCSVDTALRRMKSKACGPVDHLPGGGLRVLTEHYLNVLRSRIFAAKRKSA